MDNDTASWVAAGSPENVVFGAAAAAAAAAAPPPAAAAVLMTIRVRFDWCRHGCCCHGGTVGYYDNGFVPFLCTAELN